MSVYETTVIISILVVCIIAVGVIFHDGVPEKNKISINDVCMKKVWEASKMPNVGSLKCLLTEYNKCPKFDGSYKQCTNNYIPEPQYGNCPCHNRTFEMCPQKWKVAENVYEEGAAACKPKEIDTYHPEAPSNKSRINWWRYSGKIPKEAFIQCKGNCKVLY
jgi:hypothetical protein